MIKAVRLEALNDDERVKLYIAPPPTVEKLFVC